MEGGREISFRSDPWVPTIPGFMPCLRMEGKAVTSIMKVKELLMDGGCTWNQEEICHLFTPESAAEVLKIQAKGAGVPDKLLWTLESLGNFLVNSMHNNLVGQQLGGVSPLTTVEWHDLWHLTVHARFKMLMWKVVWDLLPTKGRVAARQRSSTEANLDILCPLYGKSLESPHHLLLMCPFSHVIWSESPWQMNIVQFGVRSVTEWVKKICHPHRLIGIPLEEQYRF